MRSQLLLALMAGVALAACAPAPREVPIGPRAPAGFPEQVYRQAVAAGQAVYRIDAASSIAVFEVHRGGALARIGHDHVVASHEVQGYIEPAAKRADLYVPLSSLTIDEPKLRREAHFDTQPSAEDIAGTGRNMRLRVLEVARYPFARIAIRSAGNDYVDADITLHGVTRAVHLPVRVAAGPNSLDVSGDFVIRQTDFGIAPLSVLGGAVRVEDAVPIRFTLHARRLQ
ncbi:MAG TPA: YceI family protein [Casimicrobiaceae bacterium]